MSVCYEMVPIVPRLKDDTHAILKRKRGVEIDKCAHFSIEDAHYVAPKTKLIPLYSNCHTMIRMTLEELKTK